jgi:hypothetical protein
MPLCHSVKPYNAARRNGDFAIKARKETHMIYFIKNKATSAIRICYAKAEKEAMKAVA